MLGVVHVAAASQTGIVIMKWALLSILLLLTSLDNAAKAAAWGIGSFENDTALDWASNFRSAESLTTIEIALAATRQQGLIGLDECRQGMAAVELLASMRDGRIDQLPLKLSSWVMQNQNVDGAELGRSALKTVHLCADESLSLLARLGIAAAPNQWLQQVDELISRLQSQ